MTRLSDLDYEPITMSELNSAIRRGDETVCKIAVALRDAWAERSTLQRAKVDADNARVQAETSLGQLSRVMGSETGKTLQDLTDLLAYGKRMKGTSELLFESLAVLKAGANLDVTAAANSLDALIRAVKVPPVVAR